MAASVLPAQRLGSFCTTTVQLRNAAKKVTPVTGRRLTFSSKLWRGMLPPRKVDLSSYTSARGNTSKFCLRQCSAIASEGARACSSEEMAPLDNTTAGIKDTMGESDTWTSGRKGALLTSPQEDFQALGLHIAEPTFYGDHILLENAPLLDFTGDVALVFLGDGAQDLVSYAEKRAALEATFQASNTLKSPLMRASTGKEVGIQSQPLTPLDKLHNALVGSAKFVGALLLASALALTSPQSALAARSMGRAGGGSFSSSSSSRSSSSSSSHSSSPSFSRSSSSSFKPSASSSFKPQSSSSSSKPSTSSSFKPLSTSSSSKPSTSSSFKPRSSSSSSKPSGSLFSSHSSSPSFSRPSSSSSSGSWSSFGNKSSSSYSSKPSSSNSASTVSSSVKKGSSTFSHSSKSNGSQSKSPSESARRSSSPSRWKVSNRRSSEVQVFIEEENAEHHQYSPPGPHVNGPDCASPFFFPWRHHRPEVTDRLSHAHLDSGTTEMKPNDEQKVDVEKESPSEENAMDIVFPVVPLAVLAIVTFFSVSFLMQTRSETVGQEPVKAPRTSKGRSRGENKGPLSETAVQNPITIVKIQVALLGEAKWVQRQMEKLCEEADTSSKEGRHHLLQESLLVLCRHYTYWAYGRAQTILLGYDAAEGTYQKMALEERAKAEQETLVNRDGKVERAPSLHGENHDLLPNEYIVVTVLAAMKGSLQTSECAGAPILGEVMSTIQGLSESRADDLEVLEVLWVPQEEDDAVTHSELVEKYTDLDPV